MKILTTFLLFVSFLSSNFLSYSQDYQEVSHETTLNYLKRSSIYVYTELNLNNIDTIPGYDSKRDKLKISGTIYNSDGITPAVNVLLYIEQPNEFGDFELKKQNGKRYVKHNAWIKTDADGRYTFFTFIPGNDRRYKILKQLFPIIKVPLHKEYALESFLFNDDYLLTKLCRKRLAKKGDITRILNPKLDNGLLVVEKNIILKRFNSDL
ncbi:hypothetical protein ES676_04755 [Bizionia saleffrena]|uniref:Intradiol ring-cleavage dioxygenases domain-containing protein n=1 Tax=Bizionia saleffrena TaxID=291189 RepID=A0A8H2LE85_9FLAO|nr:hypothetical protein [Bizionia saleffrena]TYB76658.1 hypothetical protein ES676_04755 [Bizionia saleffrena]